MPGLHDAILPDTALLMGLLIAVAVIDWRQGIIPDWLNAAIAAAGLLRLAPGFMAVGLAVVEALAVGGAVLALRWAYRRWRGIQGLGLGDVKFVAAVTPWIGLLAMPTAILAASLSGLALVLALRLGGRGLAATARIPFGPHLALGAGFAWLHGPLVWQ